MTRSKRLLAAGLLMGGCLAIALGAAWPSRWLLLRSLALALAVISLSVPIGTFLAILLTRTDLACRRLLLSLVLVLLLFPLSLQAAGWDAGFGQLGWFSFQTGQLGERPWFDGWWGAVVVHAVAALPWVVVLVSASLLNSRSSEEEQASLDADSLTVLTRVTLPRAIRAAGLAAIWVGLTTAGEITVTDLYRVRTFAEQIYLGFALDSTAAALPNEPITLVATLVMLVVASFVAISGISPNDEIASGKTHHRLPLGRGRSWVSSSLLALVVVCLAVPIANLCIQAGTTVQVTAEGVTRRWSLAKLFWQVAGSYGQFRAEFGWTLLISGVAATVVTAVALPIAWYASQCQRRSFVAVGLAALAFALPGPTVGLAIIGLLNRPEIPLAVWLYDRSIAAPVLAIAVRAFPVVLLLLWYALASLSRETTESAALAGANRWTTFWRVVLPQRRAAVGVAWIVAMAVGVGELSATILVVPPGVTTLSIRIFTLLHYGVEDQLAGLCLAELSIVAVLTFLTLQIGVRRHSAIW